MTIIKLSTKLNKHLKRNRLLNMKLHMSRRKRDVNRISYSIERREIVFRRMYILFVRPNFEHFFRACIYSIMRRIVRAIIIVFVWNEDGGGGPGGTKNRFICSTRQQKLYTHSSIYDFPFIMALRSNLNFLWILRIRTFHKCRLATAPR